jgi:hypothetical protein
MALKDGQLRAQNYWLDDNGRIEELRDGWLLAAVPDYKIVAAGLMSFLP